MANGSILARLKKYAAAKIGAKIDLCSRTMDKLELRQRHKTRRIRRRALAFSRGIIILERERKGTWLLTVEASLLKEIGAQSLYDQISPFPQRRQS
jgi:hypothetical protein